MLSPYLAKLQQKIHLTADEAAGAMTAIMSGVADPDQIEQYLVLLAEKGETADEIAGSAIVMREQAHRIRPDVPRLVDVCGTGGDKSDTFNISTTVSFVIAGARVAVAKHGNKAVSSKSGSANVLEALGVRVELAPELVEQEIEEIGIGFMFAPLFHPAMRYVAPIRAKLKQRTIFNILGPLTNPAGSQHQLLGVFSPALTRLLADTLNLMGHEHAIIVHGSGLDEATTTGPTQVAELLDENITEYVWKPEVFGLPTAKPSDLIGGDAAVNAEITRAILNGEQGPKRDIVLMNAAAGLLAADAATTPLEAMDLAIKSLDSGNAKKKLEQMIAWSNSAQ